MKHALTTGAALLLTTTMAHAVGLDRSNQDITAIFESGNYVELSFGRVMPSVSGGDAFPLAPGFPAAEYDGVASDFTQVGASLTYQIDDQITVALIIDQPFGADIVYPGSGATSLLGGTEATLNSTAITALGRYRIDDNFSVHAGLRYQTIDADITLSGQGYGPLNGYNVALDSDSGLGYVFGVAYERPEIALRVALTYNSSIEHEFSSTETLNGAPLSAAPSITTVETPESWNLDFQTGIAADTLLFGQIRYAEYEQVIVTPAVFGAQTGGLSLTSIDNGTGITLGVGRRFSDQFSASIAFGYDDAGDPAGSPLDPTEGYREVTIGGQYTMGDIVLSGGIRYRDLGDAVPTSSTGVSLANFNDNDVVSVGMSIGYRF